MIAYQKTWTTKRIVFIGSKGPDSIFSTFHHLRNVESTISMINIITLIFDKPSRRGADNRCQVPVIGAKI